jgi:hypothetical protein
MSHALLAAVLLCAPAWAQKDLDKRNKKELADSVAKQPASSPVPKVKCEATRAREAFSYSPSRGRAKTAMDQTAMAAAGSEACSQAAAMFLDRLNRLVADIKEGAASSKGRILSAEDALRVEDAWDVATDDQRDELKEALVEHYRAQFFSIRLFEKINNSKVMSAQDLPMTEPEKHVLSFYKDQSKDILDRASKKAVSDAANAPAPPPVAAAAPGKPAAAPAASKGSAARSSALQSYNLRNCVDEPKQLSCADYRVELAKGAQGQTACDLWRLLSCSRDGMSGDPSCKALSAACK